MNNYAIDSKGIGDALQRSAAAFHAANTDLSQSISLITAANTISQDPEKVGNAFTTLSARIRGTKQELEDMGEEIDDYVTNTSKLRAQVKAVSGVDIMEDENTYKDIYTILVEIGKVWKDLDDVSQAGLLEALAGKRQSNIMAGLLDNADLLEEIYETAENSAGSAEREQENYTKSIQYSFDRLTASAQEWTSTLLESDTIKWFADTANSVVELSSSFGSLNTILAALGAFFGGKFAKDLNIGQTLDSLKNFGIGAKNSFKDLSKWLRSPVDTEQLAAVERLFGETPQRQRREELIPDYGRALAALDDELNQSTLSMSEQERIRRNLITAAHQEALIENERFDRVRNISEALRQLEAPEADAWTEIGNNVDDYAFSVENAADITDLESQNILDEISSVQRSLVLTPDEEASVSGWQDLIDQADDFGEELVNNLIPDSDNLEDEIEDFYENLFNPDNFETIDLSEIMDIEDISPIEPPINSDAWEELAQNVDDYVGAIDNAIISDEENASIMEQVAAVQQSLNASEQQNTTTTEQNTNANIRNSESQVQNAATLQEEANAETANAAAKEADAAATNMVSNAELEALIASQYWLDSTRQQTKEDLVAVAGTEQLTEAMLAEIATMDELAIANKLGMISEEDLNLARRNGITTIDGLVTAQTAGTLSTNVAADAIERERIAHVRNIATMRQEAAAAKALAAAKSFAKGIVGGLVGIGISLAMPKIMEWISDLTHKTENLAKKAEEAAEKVSDITDKIKKSTSTVKEAGQKYAELAQQVGNIGTSFQNQGGLSNDEYEEFLNISNELAEVFPELTKGYDDNGNAILDLSGNVDTITGSLQNLLAIQNQIANQDILEASEDLIKNYKAQIDIINGNGVEGLEVAKARKDAAEDFIKILNEDGQFITNLKDSSIQEDMRREVMQAIFEKAGLYDDNRIVEIADLGAYSNTYDFSKFTAEEKDRIAVAYKTLAYEYGAAVSGFEDQVNKQNLQLQTFLNASLSTNLHYLSMDDNTKKLFDEFVSQFDVAEFVNNNDEIIDGETLAKAFDEQFIYAFNQVDNEAIKEKMINVLTGNIEPADIRQAYTDILWYLRDTIGSENEIYKFWGKKSVDRINQTESIADHLFYGANQKQKEQYYDDFKTKIDSLSDTERTALANLVIPNQVFYSWDELMTKIKTVNTEIKEIASPSDAVKQVNTELKSQFDALKSAYQSIFSEGYDTKKQVGKGMDLSVVDTDMLESIRAAFQDIEEAYGTAFNDEIVDDFIDVLADSASTAEEVQDAFNNLASSYFFSADGLKNLNDETANSVRQMLKQLGVVNADELVDAGLAYKQLQESSISNNNTLVEQLIIYDEYNDKINSTVSRTEKLTESERERMQAAREQYSSIQRNIQATLDEGNVADYTRLCMLELAWAEQQEALTNLDTSGKVEALTTLAETYLTAGEAAAFCGQMESMAQQAATNSSVAADLENLLNNPSALFANLEKKFGDMVGVGWDSTNKAAGSAGKSDAEAYTEAFQKEMDNLEWLKANGFINEKEYLDQLRKLYERYYKDNDKYAKEFYEHQRKYLEGIKELYENAGSAAEDILDEEIDKYEELRDAEIEALEEQKKAIEERIKGIEDEIDKKQKLID